jgi:hypothetical protein
MVEVQDSMPHCALCATPLRVHFTSKGQLGLVIRLQGCVCCSANSSQSVSLWQSLTNILCHLTVVCCPFKVLVFRVQEMGASSH